MFKNPFTLNGRIRRLEYGLSYLMYFVSIIVMAVLLFTTGTITDTENPQDTLSLYIACLPAIWFLVTQGAKRCHDRGNSGWWQLIPFYGFWMMFTSGDIGDNEYGPNPKGLYYDFEDGNEEAPIDDVDEDGIIK